MTDITLINLHYTFNKVTYCHLNCVTYIAKIKKFADITVIDLWNNFA